MEGKPVRSGLRNVAGTLLVVSALVAACGGGTASSAPRTPGATSPGATTPSGTAATSGATGAVLEPLGDAVTVRFGVFPNITHAPGLVALADGGTLEQLLSNAT